MSTYFSINVDSNTMDSIASDYDLVLCADCGCDEYYQRDDCYYASDADEYYSTSDELYYCSCCGNYVTEQAWNHEQECCTDCEHYNYYIESYHAGKDEQEFILYDDNEDYKGIGIELEVENTNISAYELDECAGEIKGIINSGYTRTEEDCSLDNGFEIITAPHTKKAFYEILLPQIEKAQEYLKDNGFRSHDGGSCGLHLHFSKLLFGSSFEEQRKNISKLLKFYDMHFDKLEAIARRKANIYCKKNTSIDDGHGYAINNDNYSTLEFRLGRGTLNYTSLKAWIDFHWSLIEHIADEDFNIQSFDYLVSQLDDEKSKSYISEKIYYDKNNDYIAEVA